MAAEDMAASDGVSTQLEYRVDQQCPLIEHDMFPGLGVKGRGALCFRRR
jgi:hypothetical protein